VAALCPTIYGHELVKAGLLLSLFGGVRKHGSSNNRVRQAAAFFACGDDGDYDMLSVISQLRAVQRICAKFTHFNSLVVLQAGMGWWPFKAYMDC
jgi:hypothetical protein